MKGLSKELQASIQAQSLALMGALSEPYLALAGTIAQGLASVKGTTDKAREKRETVWGGFKSAVVIAQDSGHTPQAMREGLEIACATAEIPPGTFRGYIATIEAMATEVLTATAPYEGAGVLSVSEAQGLSVADARKRYKEPLTADELALNDAKARLAAAVKDWDAASLALLADYAEEMNATAPETEEEEEALAA